MLGAVLLSVLLLLLITAKDQKRRDCKSWLSTHLRLSVSLLARLVVHAVWSTLVSNDNQTKYPLNYGVTQANIVRGRGLHSMAPTQQPTVEERSSSDTTASSIKSPRMARFVEATTVQSPTGPADTSRSPFADPPGQSQTHPDVSDVGFGYVAANDSVQHVSHHQLPVSPLKSALKVPGTPGRTLNPLSPTFREEFYVEKEEKSAEKENARDLVSGVEVK